MRGEILLTERLRNGGLELRRESFHVHLPITRHANDQRMTSAINLSDHQTTFFNVSLACQGRRCAGTAHWPG